MSIKLPAVESQILGLVVEAQLLSPKEYPVTAAHLLKQCQERPELEGLKIKNKSAVEDVLSALKAKNLLVETRSTLSRSKRYQHQFGRIQRPLMELTSQELALLSALMVHGPLGPGKLFEHASKLYDFSNISEIMTVLHHAVKQSTTPLVSVLPYDSAQGEQRYTHLFDPSRLKIAPDATQSDDFLIQQIQELREENTQIREKLELLQKQVDILFDASPSVSNKHIL